MNIIILDDYQDAVRKLKAAAKLEHLNAKVFTNTVKGIGQLSVRLRDAEVLVLIRERTQFPRQLLEKLPNPVAEPEWHGYVSSLFVCPDARGAGLGSRLLGAALAECDRRGCDAVVLWPTPRSRSLYLRHDFAVRDDLLERRGRRTSP